MAKYSFKFKMMIAKEYCNGKAGYKYLVHKYNLHPSIVKCWVTNYNYYGQEAPQRYRKQKLYTFEFKPHVVELYLSSEISYQDLAIQEGISNPSMISNWVNRFRAAGPDALKSRKKGRKRTLDKPKIDIKVQEAEERIVDTSAEHIRELEDELLKLRIENAFLKELRRLRLEDEAKMRERHSSSIASEENSN